MASRMADSVALVERCKRAGWDVQRSTNGYKIRDLRGGQHTVHMTYSDVRSLTNCTKAMEAAGLSDDEDAVKGKRLTENRSRADIAREAAEKRGKEMAAKASVVKAAGPYLVDDEDVDLEWFITPHPAPWVRRVKITPQIARKLLADHNADNRPASANQIKFYKEIIKAELWHLTHQGIAIDSRGILQDGQHRMYAQLAACEEVGHDITLPYFVFVGMDPANFKAIDEGMLRNARQLFGKAGEKNATALQGIVRLVHYAMDGDARRASRLKLPNQTVVDEFGADPDSYRECAHIGMRDYRKAYTSAVALGAAIYLLHKVNGRTNEFVGQFYDGLITGRIPGTRIVLDDDDPREVFRQRMQSIRLKGESRTAMTQMGMIITSWNNCVLGRTPRTLYFSDDTAIPQPLRCIPGEGIRPNAFGTLVTGTTA
jgi:hypothetical protein